MLERELISPAPFYQEFKPLWSREKPELTSLNHLIELLKNYPQNVNGKLRYLIDGGAATYIHIYNDSHTRTVARHEPPDIDLITEDKELIRELVGIPEYDPRDLAFWLEGRGFKSSEKIKKRVFSSATKTEISGRDVYILDKPTLSVAKLAVFRDSKTGESLPPRPKDINDVKLLRVPPSDIKRAFNYLGGVPGGIWIPTSV